MQPFGIQIIFYLFLAGIAAGAAFFASLSLTSRKEVPFRGARHSLVLAIACALTGSVFLILDLTRPADFFLILTSANAGSAISWGARILVLFTLSAIFVWTIVRSWNQSEIERGFVGTDLIGLWLLRIAALGLAIYPAFVLLQGDAFSLWQNPFLVPLLATSALHSGLSAHLLISRSSDCESRFRTVEFVLGIAQIALLMAMFSSPHLTLIYFLAMFCTGIAISFPGDKFKAPIYRHLLAVVAAFLIRYWLISAGQTI